MPRTAEVEIPPAPVATAASEAAFYDDRDYPAENRIVLDGISWSQYEKLSKVFEGRRVFITYDDGLLEIMTTSARHESGKSVLAFLVELYALERNIPIRRFGSMTCKLKKFKKGFEPDECYYILHELAVRENREFDFDKDPPPDLGLEVEISRRISTRERIYAALGVPELWRTDGEAIRVFHLREGRYEQRPDSLNFPQLPIAELERFLRMLRQRSEHEVMRAFREWLRTLPR